MKKPHQSSTLRATAAVLVTAGLWSASTSGCAGTPRQRNVPGAEVETGGNSIESVRRQLEGRWTLVSLEFGAETGQKMNVDAAGDLAMDGFGNLDIVYRLSDAGLATLERIGVTYPNPVITTRGLAVIDPQRQQITYMPPDAGARTFDPDLAARRANPFALEHVRYYTLVDNILTLTTRYENGQDAIVSRWEKTSTRPQ